MKSTTMLKIAYLIMFISRIVWVPAIWIRWCAKKLLEYEVAFTSENFELTRITRPDFHWLDFPWLDWTFYEDVAQKMSKDGFRCIGDFEHLALSKLVPTMRTYLKCFMEDTGTVMATAYHMKRHGWGLVAVSARDAPESIQAIEFETEFDDHTFLTTHNLAGLDGNCACPEITTEQHEPGTPYEKLLLHHREKLQSIVEERRVQPVRFDTLEDFLSAQDRIQAIRSAQHRRIGYITRDQLEAIFGGKLSKAQRLFVDEFERARRDNPSP